MLAENESALGNVIAFVKVQGATVVYEVGGEK